jgi:hypothetical protein
MKIFRLFVGFTLVCFALLPPAQAVVPAPDGVYPNFTTAEGQNALQSLTTGAGNTALGAFTLFGTSTNSFNTAVGAGALDLNTGDDNTAVGAASLLLNTGINNTAVGTAALELNESGNGNTATGAFALFSNQSGGANVAIGVDTMGNNTSGAFNTAVGFAAGGNLVLGSYNIYIGDSAGTLDFLGNSPGDESGTIRIGSFAAGADACFINGIATNGPFANTVTIDPATGQLGGFPSSARFKKDIEPMDETSEAIYSLKPVTFHYKKDKTNTPWFGLIAEDVAKVNPALIGVDSEGKPYCVAYDKVNAMLLNEFLKEHRKVQELEANAVRQQKEIEALAQGLQKVSAQLELNKPAPQTVLNNR